MCVTAAGEVTEGTGKFQVKGASHGWGEEVLLGVKSRTDPGAKGRHLLLQEERPSGITLRNPELDVIAKMFLGCLGMDMRMFANNAAFSWQYSTL